MELSIIIPAYNEEENIKDIVFRCLNAKNAILDKTPVNNVEVIVVSDGSYDGTVEKAKKFVPQIKLIHYPKNKGYGKAIKIGFQKAKGSLLSFLDADGTCDPMYFVEMINKLLEEDADICIGSRMGPNSKMPTIRKFGNKIWCIIINGIANVKISDAASGMRVIRKDKLNQIYPLPDGLHFTPAMSCRAVLDHHLKIVEVDMSYEERKGESKLQVINDGLRFLNIIMSIALTYKPLRVIGTAGLILILLSLLYIGITVVPFLRTDIIEKDLIYRLIPIIVFGVSGMLLLGIGSLADKAIRLIYRHPLTSISKISKTIRWLFSWKRLRIVAPLTFFSGIILNHQNIYSWIITGTFAAHWLYVVAGGYLVLLGVTWFILGVIDYIFDLISEKIFYTNQYDDDYISNCNDEINIL